jgi:hypothetical protein
MKRTISQYECLGPRPCGSCSVSQSLRRGELVLPLHEGRVCGGSSAILWQPSPRPRFSPARWSRLPIGTMSAVAGLRVDWQPHARLSRGWVLGRPARRRNRAW